jgi:hypothetical protein
VAIAFLSSSPGSSRLSASAGSSVAALIAAIRLPSAASRGVATANASANVTPRLKASRRERSRAARRGIGGPRLPAPGRRGRGGSTSRRGRWRAGCGSSITSSMPTSVCSAPPPTAAASPSSRTSAGSSSPGGYVATGQSRADHAPGGTACPRCPALRGRRPSSPRARQLSTVAITAARRSCLGRRRGAGTQRRPRPAGRAWLETCISAIDKMLFMRLLRRA